MANRAWPDGPTWEELVRSAVSYAAALALEGVRLRQRQSATLHLVDALAIPGEHAERLCRACGYDPETGEKIEEERC